MDTFIPTPDQELLARQLIRFLETGHPNGLLADPDHIEFATRIKAASHLPQEKSDVLAYPVEWAESKARFRAFLAKWKVKYNALTWAASSITEPAVNPADVPFPLTPQKPEREPQPPDRPHPVRLQLESDPPSVGQSPSSNFNARFYNAQLEDTQETIRRLADFTFNSPTTERDNNLASSRSPSIEQPRAEPPANQGSTLPIMPLTPAETSNMMAEAFERHRDKVRTDMAEAVLRSIIQLQQEGIMPTPTQASPAAVTAPKAEDVGYFNPSMIDYDGSGSVSQSGKTVYTDVWAFTDRLKQLAVAWGEDKVKMVWLTCLKTTALQWSSTELSDLEKTALQQGSVDLICTALQQRFRKDHGDAQASLQRSRFTMYDLAQGHSMRPFVQRVIRDAKSCDLPERNQLIAAFQAFDHTIQGQLEKPTESTTLGAFLKRIDERESILVGQARQIYKSNAYRSSYPQQRQGVAADAFYGKHENFSNTPQPPTSHNRGTDRQPFNQTPTPPFDNFRGRERNNRYRGNFNRGAGFGRGRSRQPYSPFYNSQPAQSPQWTPAAPPPVSQNSRFNSRQRGTGRFNQRYNNAYLAEEGHITPGDDWETQSTRAHFSSPQPDHPDFGDTDIMTSGPIPEGFGPPDLDAEDDSQDAANFGVALQAVTIIKCRFCSRQFPSNNKLHQHLKAEHLTSATPEYANVAIAYEMAPAAHADARMDINNITAATHPAHILKVPEKTSKSSLPIVQSAIDSKPDVGTGFAQMTKSYLKMFLMVSPTSEHQEEIVGDTGCTRTIADTHWAKIHFKDLEIRKRAVPLIIKGIANEEHTTSDYAIIRFFFKGYRDNQTVVASFVREVTLVDGLQTKMLLGMDILDSERFDILLSRKIAVIQSCRVTIPLSCTGSSHRAKAKVRIAERVILPPKSMAMIAVSHSATFNQDCIFEPTTNIVSCYAALANDSTTSLPVRNDSDHRIVLTPKTTLGYMAPIDPECRMHHVVEEGVEDLALKPAPSVKADKTLTHLKDFTLSSTNTIVHPSGVTIYRHPDPKIAQAFFDLITRYQDVFEDTGFALVDEDERPIYHLRPGWEHDIAKKCKVYNVNQEDQQIIDTTIDKLLKKNVIFENHHFAPMSFPVFVIWRMVHAERKGRMVVDVRPFNAINLRDSYPMKSQEEMLGKIYGCTFITLLDAVAFYYQWLTHPSTRWAMTINTTKGQYTFNSLVMGYKNSNAFVQRQMDRLLRPVSAADCYCDDICISSHAFPNHMSDLDNTFSLLRHKNISIGPSKSFIGFPSAVVLGRVVDSFGLSTTKERLDAIANLSFPRTLKDLETFIGMTGYMRNNVPRYAQLLEPLEKRKTDMLKGRRQGRTKAQRKKWASSVPIDEPTADEQASFEGIKAALTKHTVLYFFSPHRVLCIDFDVARSGIGVTVYHIDDATLPDIQNEDGTLKTFPPPVSVQPIAFLSRNLSTAEKRYWPSEMEVLGFVWAIRKTEHWLNVAKAGIYVFTDHRAIMGMIKYKDLVNSTALSNKNLRLVRAMEYVSKFDVIVMHKPGKQNVIPDALSRLPVSTQNHPSTAEGELERLPDDRDEHLHNQQQECSAFLSEVLPILRMTTLHLPDSPMSKPIPLIQIDPSFKLKLQQGYHTDPRWTKALQVIKANDMLPVHEQAILPFTLRDGLLWKRSETADRLCVPRNCSADIFKLIHGQNHVHAQKFSNAMLQFVVDRKDLARYVQSCPECAILKSRNHKPYGSLQPILSPPCPFHTVTMDIALGFPLSHHDNNAFMVTVCKLSKSIQIIPGRHDWTAKQWATALVARLLLATWGLPKILLTDRDPKFLADLWQQIWTNLGTKLLYATAYHPATDGQSERMIRTIKSTFRYYFHSLHDVKAWEEAIPRLQFEMNNTKAASTNLSPNEVVLGFTPTFIMDILSNSSHQPCPRARIEAHDAIAISSMSMKYYYDQNHAPAFFEVGQNVLLRLHKGYNIPKAAILGSKIGQQFAGPFKITEKIGRSAYRLNFPDSFKIHNVISVDHLEPAPPLDIFGRFLPNAGTVHLESYGRKLIASKPSKSGPKYLVEYIGLGPEFNRWMTKPQLAEGAQELIDDFVRRQS